MTDRELMQQALDALERYENGQQVYFDDEIEALRARLAQCDAGEICLGCRVCPDAEPQREWQGLTDEEIRSFRYDFEAAGAWFQFARAIEDKMKEKNHG